MLSVLFLTETITAVKLPPKLIIPAVIAFGDSIVDTGMNNNVKTVVKCDFLPYGINFQSGVATGRFCDGRVPADLLGSFSLTLFLKRIANVKKYYVFIYNE